MQLSHNQQFTVRLPNPFSSLTPNPFNSLTPNP